MEKQLMFRDAEKWSWKFEKNYHFLWKCCNKKNESKLKSENWWNFCALAMMKIGNSFQFCFLFFMFSFVDCNRIWNQWNGIVVVYTKWTNWMISVMMHLQCDIHFCVRTDNKNHNAKRNKKWKQTRIVGGQVNSTWK